MYWRVVTIIMPLSLLALSPWIPGSNMALAGPLDCSQPIPYAVGQVLEGDNTGLTNNVTDYGGGFFGVVGMTGGEQAYVIEIDRQYSLVGVTISCETVHSVALLKSCNPSDDEWTYSHVGRFSEVFSLTPGTYYLVIDSSLADEGPFTISSNGDFLHQAADRCDSPDLPLLDPLDYPINVMTTGTFAADYMIPAGGCQGDMPDGVDGIDLVYGFELNDTTFLEISHSDSPFYITTDCGDSDACVTGSDWVPRDSEFLFTHAGPRTRYFLVFHDYHGVVNFSYRHNGDKADGVGVVRATWGTLKSLYR